MPPSALDILPSSIIVCMCETVLLPITWQVSTLATSLYPLRSLPTTVPGTE